MELKANILRIERLSSPMGRECGRLYFLRAVPCAVPVFDTGVAVGAAGSLLYERALHRMRRLHPGLSGTGTSPERKNGRDREGSQPL